MNASQNDPICPTFERTLQSMKNGQRSIFVKAKFAPKVKKEIVQVPTGEKKAALFGLVTKEVTRKEERIVPDGFSDCRIDGQRLAEDIQGVIDDLSKEGFQIVTTIPVVSGNWDRDFGYWMGSENPVKKGWHAWGYSYLDGVVLIAQRTAAAQHGIKTTEEQGSGLG